MLKVLIGTRFLAMWKSMFSRLSRNAKKQNKGMTILFSVLAIYVIASIFATVGGMFYFVAKPLIGAGLSWLYFALAGLMSVALCFIGSIFATQSQIFDAKDNELLLSMPIPPTYILASRLILLLLMNILYTLFVLLPAGAVYCYFAPVSVSMIAAFVVAVLLLPFFSLAIACVCGWLVELISSKIRHRNLISTILMLAFFFGYLFVYINLQNYLTELVKNGAAFGDAIERSFPPVYFFGSAIGNVNWLHLAFLSLWCLVPFFLVYALLSRSFIKIATTKKGAVKVKYQERALTVSSVKKALFLKELRRFFTLPAYILNSGLGAIMQVLFAGALIIKGPEILNSFVTLPEITQYIPALLCGVLCFCAVMTNTTAPSISLEGKNLWILKSNPINPADIFLAKVGANLSLGIPATIIAAVVCWVTVPMTLLQGIEILLLPIVIQIFSALWGLTANLWFPRFDWINTTLVIKQSMSAIVGMLGALAIAVIPVIVYIAALSNIILVEYYLIICFAFFTLVSAGLMGYIMTEGKRLFERM